MSTASRIGDGVTLRSDEGKEDAMDRRPNRNPVFVIVVVVVGVLVAVGIAVVFDSPTSVYLLGGLAIAGALVSIYSDRRGNR